MFQKIKTFYARLKGHEPGTRFIKYYRYRNAKQKDSYAKASISIVIGCALLGVGVLFAFLPVLPGFLFAVPGLAILAARSKFTARTLDRSEMFFRRLFHRTGCCNRKS